MGRFGSVNASEETITVLWSLTAPQGTKTGSGKQLNCIAGAPTLEILSIKFPGDKAFYIPQVLQVHMNSLFGQVTPFVVSPKRIRRLSPVTDFFAMWHFSGSYSNICEDKVTAFKERVYEVIRTCRAVDTVAFLKRLNRKIDGFGNNYKHGELILPLTPNRVQ